LNARPLKRKAATTVVETVATIKTASLKKAHALIENKRRGKLVLEGF
jgi:hypothetical protein